MDNKNKIKAAILDSLSGLVEKTIPSHYILELAKFVDIYEEEFPGDDMLLILTSLRDGLLRNDYWHNIKDHQYDKTRTIIRHLFSIKINDVLVTDSIIELERIGVLIPPYEYER